MTDTEIRFAQLDNDKRAWLDQKEREGCALLRLPFDKSKPYLDTLAAAIAKIDAIKAWVKDTGIQMECKGGWYAFPNPRHATMFKLRWY